MSTQTAQTDASTLPPNAAAIEITGPCTRKVSITIPAPRVDQEFESTLKTVMGSVHFPGFRPGRAPRALVEARMGERVLAEVKQRLVESAVEDAITGHGLKIVGNPRMNYEDAKIARGAEMAFHVEVDVRPEFTVPKLEDVTVRRPDLTVTEKHVDDAVEDLRMDRATTADAGDEPVRERGICTLTVKIVSGETTIVDAGDVEWQLGEDVLGGMVIQGLNAAILGKKKGDTVEFTQPLPSDFRDEEWRGKDSHITVRIDAVQHVTLPDVTDEWTKEMDYDGIADMRAELRKRLERDAENNRELALDNAVVDALLAAVPFDVPPSLVTSETERMLRRYETQLRRQGVPDQDIALQLQQTITAAATKVTRDLRASFLLDRIAAEKKVFVTETEIRGEIARMAQQYGRQPNEMEAQLEQSNLLSALRIELREKKTIAAVRGVVKIEDAPASGGNG